jgi:hypothetical protein
LRCWKTSFRTFRDTDSNDYEDTSSVVWYEIPCPLVKPQAWAWTIKQNISSSTSPSYSTGSGLWTKENTIKWDMTSQLIMKLP